MKLAAPTKYAIDRSRLLLSRSVPGLFLGSASPLALGIVAALFALIALLFASWTAQKAGIDDVYITYVYARSFAEGHGLTWPGSTGLGTSSPFLAVLLGGSAALTGLAIPWLGNAVSWISIAAAALGLFALGRREGWPRAGFAGGILWLVLTPSHALLGNEYLPAIAAVIWAFHERARGRLLSTGLLLALAAMFRAEAGLAAPFVALLELRRESGPVIAASAASARRIARIAAAAIVLAALWLAILFGLAGTVLPRTLAAKRAQVDSALGVWQSGRPLLEMLAEPGDGFSQARQSWWPPLAIAGAASLAFRRRPKAASGQALIAWGAAHLALVAGLGIPFYPWYAAPFKLALLLLPAFALEAPPFPLLWARRAWSLVALGALGAVVYAARPDLNWLRAGPGDPRQASYARAADLAALYPEGTRIAAWEVGFLGWQSSRPVADLLGLVSDRASLDAVRDGDLHENIARLDADLLMVTLRSRGLITSLLGEPHRFLADYRLDSLQIQPTPPIAIYRRAALPGHGEVQLDLLAELPKTTPIRLHTTDGLGLLSIALDRGAEVRLTLPPGGKRPLGALLTSSKRKGRLLVRIQVGTKSQGSIQNLDSDGWTRFSTVIPPAPEGATITFACVRGAGCLVGQPYLGQPPPEPTGRWRRQAERQRKKKRS